MSPVRVTPDQAAQLQRRRKHPDTGVDDTPVNTKPGRPERHPVLATECRKPTVLLSVDIKAPRVEGGCWTVKASYSDGHTTLGACSQEEAEKWKRYILSIWRTPTDEIQI